MGKVDLEPQVKELTSAIDELINQTQDIYGSIYQQLPEIEREIELTIQEMDILLEYFLPSNDKQIAESSDSEDMYKLSEVLSTISANLSQNRKKMIDEETIRQTIDSLLLNKEDAAKQINIDHLTDKLIEIKERVTDVELIAMNAMIYAANLENGGVGFGVVADNIKKVATELKSYYTEMQSSANKLYNWNLQFVENLEKLLECHQQLNIEQIDQFEEIISVIFESLTIINELLADLIENIKVAMEPIQELMISIQSQDLIEQNLEFINNGLNSIRELESEFIKEGKVDFQLFTVQFLDLAVDSLDIVKEELNSSLNELCTCLDKIRDDTNSLRQDGKLITDFLGGEQELNTYSSVEEIFKEINSFIEQFSVGLLRLEQEIEDISDFDHHFYKLVTEIEEWIISIKGRVDFLQKLKLLSKIELSRLETGNKSFGQEISQISAEIAAEVEDNEELVWELKESLEVDLEKFKDILNVNQENIGDMSGKISVCQEELGMVEQLISEAIWALRSSAERLFAEIDEITEELLAAQNLLHRLQEIEEQLLKLKNENEVQLIELTGIDAREQSLEKAKLRELLAEFEQKQISINSSKNDDFNDGEDAEEGLVLF
ncbi:hypothetical protein [Fuchsiella alkaliacetigena]|uniref:hypothetical protein n=1 Tax=Fuchsiella alkaliacetigena TaxID=957042 RepID=UPI00200AE4BA|nr:hypothetical protein [Fuchsiella alkaliacetigena]MCK8824821.1 hypothetical protein [Fuchsiella alkaliacetigena]